MDNTHTLNPNLPLSADVMKALKKLAEEALSMHVGLKARRKRNQLSRAKGVEPEPGWDAGVKRRARYLKRVTAAIAAEPHIHPRHKRATA